jgi:hypothetical protein
MPMVPVGRIGEMRNPPRRNVAAEQCRATALRVELADKPNDRRVFVADGCSRADHASLIRPAQSVKPVARR